jgi:hypothetical protein
LSDEVPLIPPSVFDKSRLRPGSVVVTSGIYRVHHYRHRMPHIVFIEAGTTLPPCKRCGEAVEFAPLIAAEAIEGDEDLSKNLKATG